MEWSKGMNAEELKLLCNKKFSGLLHVEQGVEQSGAGVVECPQKGTRLVEHGACGKTVENLKCLLGTATYENGAVEQQWSNLESIGFMRRDPNPDEVTFPAQHRGCGGVFAPVVIRIPGSGDGMMCTRCRKWRRAPAKAFEKGVEV